MDDYDRAGFVGLLLKTQVTREWRLHAYCLMTTHVHLVIETPHANISSGLQWLFAVHAQRFNRRWGRFGHLFADRFWSRVIERDDYFEELCRYVLQNPVKAGLCEHPSEWRWSGGIVFQALSGTPLGV
jgi:REP element-mobilizing transposase RayT